LFVSLVSVAELALDHDQWHTFASHLDGVGMSQLVRREASANAGFRGRPAELRSSRGRRLVAAARGAADDAKQLTDRKLESRRCVRGRRPPMVVTVRGRTETDPPAP
jgi:hypothetical protein